MVLENTIRFCLLKFTLKYDGIAHYYQFNQKPYSISPPSIFGYIATHMIVKIFYYHVPPWYWTIPGGDMIVNMFLLTCPPLVLFNTRGGHESKDNFTIMSPPGIEQYQGGTCY